jgi:NADPH:quinone reductase-like Zn-dependent oxidoreductase
MPAGDGQRREVWVAPPGRDPVGAELAAQLLARIRSCVAAGGGLDVCTRGALSVSGVGGDPAHAALWGLARVARTEHPVLGLRLFDLDPRGDVVQAVVAALTAADDEEELAVRGEDRLTARIERVPPARPDASPTRRMLPDGASARLVVARPGALDTLGFVPAPRVAPGPGEVEIEIEAAPLNFKDVMKGLGLLDEVALEATYLGTDLGMEAVGRVVRTGAGAALQEGQRVLVYRGGALRTHIVADARFAVPCPAHWRAEDAACFFVTVTAWHALAEVARLAAGETVLVHSAAGGVGLAAVGVARRLGARVIATAGTDDKRAFLRRQPGIDAVLDSRTLDFGDEVLALTGGRGVDVVLNSLGGRAIDVGLQCLAPGGRFVELGKRDLADGRPVSLRAFNRRTALLAVDLDRAAGEAPDSFPPLARTVLDELTAGRLPLLPAEVFAADRVVDAFRALASGGHIGKVAVRMDGPLPRAEGVEATFRPTPGRSWLVTGGLGGFGLATAAWLAERGVTHLVLASRRGRARGAEAAVLARLCRGGTEVTQVALDVSDSDAVHALIGRLRCAAAPLGGVVHAAAVLDDAPLDRLEPEALRRVLDAKARGAWHLHCATADADLEGFVMYGSIAAQVGNPGQAAYAAANVSLEVTRRRPRSRGRSAGPDLRSGGPSGPPRPGVPRYCGAGRARR